MKYLACLLVLLFSRVGVSQIIPPYYNKFDQNSDTVGWVHYALSGTDDWEWGVPVGPQLTNPYSPPKVWATKLNGLSTPSSEMCLVSPSFNFSDTTTKWRLAFAHKYHLHAANNAVNVEYSTNGGINWILLNGSPSDKATWYTHTTTVCSGTNSAWSSTYTSIYNISLHKLNFLAGQNNVKFRLKVCNAGNMATDGWMIDNFSIEESKPNVFCAPTSITRATKFCPTFSVSTFMHFYNMTPTVYPNVTRYYISSDTILDGLDPIIASYTANYSTTYMNWNYTFNIPSGYQNTGVKYVFASFDVTNNLNESNETDNVCMHRLYVDSVYNVPLVSDLDNSPLWSTNNPNKWQLGEGNRVLFEGAHSGTVCYRNLNNNPPVYQGNYLESPNLNNKFEDSTIFSLWYVCKQNFMFSPAPIQYKQGCLNNNTYGDIGGISPIAPNKWSYLNYMLPQAADTSRNLVIRILPCNGFAFPPNNFQNHDMLIDDIYIGRIKSDLSVECDTKNRYTATSDVVDTIRYSVLNSGLKSCQSSTTAFYWSTDSIFDMGDVFLGTVSESAISATTSINSLFVYTKPSLLPGKYFIFYRLDSTGVVNEMREYNNRGAFILYQAPKVSFPYYNDFESQITNWRHNSSLNRDEWLWTIPNKTLMTSAYSGTRAWITNDTGRVSPHSRMHLYTPLFDLTGAVRPVLEFDLLAPYIQNGTTPALMNMSYSTDNGASWQILDTTSNSYNRWYYTATHDIAGGTDGVGSTGFSGVFFAALERFFVTSDLYNGRDCKRIHRYVLDIKRFVGVNKIQFRFNLTSNNTLGVLLDNFTLREGMPDLFFDYKKALMISSTSDTLRLNGQLKNRGNYVANPGTIRFYLSVDTVFNLNNDSLIGTFNYNYLRPDNYAYFNQFFRLPQNFSTFKFLIIRSDVNNTTNESDENNNDVCWSLSLDSLNNVQYSNSFNDTVVNGWTGYAIQNNGNIANHRVRYRVPPAGSLYQYYYRSGELFTDQVDGSGFYNPTFYIESPKFNFSGCESIFLSFKLMCTGNIYQNGGYMEYSIDGGKTFSFLNPPIYQTPYNYNLSAFNHYGWAGTIGVNWLQILAPVQVDASFLSGQGDVVFRFVHKSHYYYAPGAQQGMRIDDFGVSVTKVDYKANDLGVLVSPPINSSTLNLYYSFDYNEPFVCPSNSIKFYWSTDNIFDSNDQLFETRVISSGTGPSTVNDSININLNNFNFQNTAYVFYMLDRDSLQIESNENNNIGSFTLANLVGLNANNPSTRYAFIHNSNLIIRSSGANNEKRCKISLIDAKGIEVFKSQVELQSGQTVFPLPTNLSKGLYYVIIESDGGKYTLRYILQ